MDQEATSVTAIVLAAGESKRMGAENKLLLSFNGKPVIEHIVGAVLGSSVNQVIVVIGHEKEKVREALKGYDVSFVENASYQEGMGTSIRVGIECTTEDVAGYMVCLSDLPLITSDEYTFLVHAFLEQHAHNPEAITIPEFKGQRGNPVILSSVYRLAMLARQGVMGCKGIVKKHPEHVQRIEMATDHVVFDIDTPEAYQRLIDEHRL